VKIYYLERQFCCLPYSGEDFDACSKATIQLSSSYRQLTLLLPGPLQYLGYLMREMIRSEHEQPKERLSWDHEWRCKCDVKLKNG